MAKPDIRPWTVQDSEALYMVPAWGEGYFRVGADGQIHVLAGAPKRRLDEGPAEGGIGLGDLVEQLTSRGVATPLLLRFGDILEDRIRRISGAFAEAIEDCEYRGRYRGVYPIKVNQERHVVEEIVGFGRQVGLGLECGSKPELVIALAMHTDPDALIVCNGVKDRDYLELAMLGRKLGKQVVVVLDRVAELYECLEVADRHEVDPLLGVRVRLAARGAGKWIDCTGDRSKFGLTYAQLVEVTQGLQERGRLDCLRMLHFHIGSQITDIRAIKRALREGARVYTELVRLGAAMGWVDVGGGLGVDYDGSQTNFHSSINYSLQEYANDVVYTVQVACDEHDCPHPDLVSESGRALVAHHAVLVVDVVASDQVTNGSLEPPAGDDDPDVLASLYETLELVNRKNYIESFHDAVALREEAQQRFNLGYLDLAARARADCVFYAIGQRILGFLGELDEPPEELEPLPRAMADILYLNFSVFQSLPDHWAVRQLFPAMPIHRLGEKPTRRATIADLTCDSDGKMDRFIDVKDVADFVHVHELNGRPYYVGFFLVGAYQEVLGDLHNLFGDSNAVHVKLCDDGSVDASRVVAGDRVGELLGYLQYDPEDLLARLDHAAAATFADAGTRSELTDSCRRILRQDPYLRR